MTNLDTGVGPIVDTVLIQKKEEHGAVMTTEHGFKIFSYSKIVVDGVPCTIGQVVKQQMVIIKDEANDFGKPMHVDFTNHQFFCYHCWRARLRKCDEPGHRCEPVEEFEGYF